MRLDVLVYFYRQFNVQCHVATNAMIAGLVKAGVNVSVPTFATSGVIHWSRNDSLKVIRRDADWVLMVDDDMLPQANSGVLLLDAAEKAGVPLISALTCTRKIPTALNVKKYVREEDRFVHIEAVKPDTLLSGDFGVGAGFLLVSHRLLKAVKEYWLTAQDWHDDNWPLFNRLGVKWEAATDEMKRLEGERRARYKETGGTTRVFNFMEAPLAEQNGEDIAFCRKVLKLGYPVSAHTGIQVGHVGDFPYGPWNLMDKKPENLNLSCDTVEEEPPDGQRTDRA